MAELEQLLLQNGIEPAVAAIIGTLFLFFFIFALAAYIYLAIAQSKTAKKLGTKNPWLAWIPIANLVLLANMAGMHWWPILLYLLVFIPFIGALASLAVVAFMTIWLWKVAEKRGQPGWLSLFIFVPFLGGIWYYVLWGILAWQDKPLVQSETTTTKKVTKRKAPAKRKVTKKKKVSKKK